MQRWLWLVIAFAVATLLFLAIAAQRVSLLQRDAERPRIEEAFARGLATGSACAQKGVISLEGGIYNQYTATWWFELEMKPDFIKEGCSPACVVNALNSTAEINWR